MKKAAPILETPRLILSDIQQEDTEKIVFWRSDPKVYCFFLSPHKVTTEEHLNWFHSRYLLDETRYDFMAKQKGTGESIGVFGVRYLPDQNAAEISYILGKTFRSQGYATEAMTAVMDFSQDFWPIQQWIAEIHKGNASSLHFAQKLGFTKVGENSPFWIFTKEICRN